MERTTLGTSRLLGRAGTLPPGGGGGGGGGPPNPGIGGGGGGGGGGPDIAFVEEVCQIFSVSVGLKQSRWSAQAREGGWECQVFQKYIEFSPRAHEGAVILGANFSSQILIKKNRNQWRFGTTGKRGRALSLGFNVVSFCGEA